jgi:uncharacterized membrane protein YeiH
MNLDLIYIVDLLGTFVFAISGIMAALEKKFDLFGAITLGFVTAVGGGTLRDMLIGRTPVGWMQDSNYFLVIVAAMPVCYLFTRKIQQLRRGLFLFDTIGIGLFTVLGVQKVLETGLSVAVAITMGVVSAVFGGVIRDVLSNIEPLIFRREIYASACLAGGLAFVILNNVGLVHEVNILISIVLIIIIRYLAVKNKWSLLYLPKEFR